MIRSKMRKADPERGVALLIAIFVLVVISGIAISLIVMSGTESSLAANYKRNTSVFYAAQAGIEEGRARLTPCFPALAPDIPLWQRPPGPVDACANPQKATDPLFSLAPVAVGGAGQVVYIRNGVTMANILTLTDRSYDWQYTLPIQNGGEGGTAADQAAARPNFVSSVLMAAGQPAMNYKWVRINLKSEAMGGIPLTAPPNNPLNTITPLLVMNNSTQCISGSQVGGMNCTSSPDPAVATFTSSPVYRVTALAVDPSGTQRLVQAEVALPSIVNLKGSLTSQASVTINGKFTDTGTDYCGQLPPANGITSAGSVTVNGGSTSITTAPPAQPIAQCNPPTPACQQANFPYSIDQIISSFAPPASTLAENFVNPSGTPSGVTCLPPVAGNMSCGGQGTTLGTLPSPWPVAPNTVNTNAVPAITYADTGSGGSLKLTGQSSGAGILVVEGDLYLGGGFQWYGLIIVRGTVTLLGGGGSPTNIVGGILSGRDINNANLNTSTGGSNVIRYDSCAYRNLVGQAALRVLSFREIKHP